MLFDGFRVYAVSVWSLMISCVMDTYICATVSMPARAFKCIDFYNAILALIDDPTNIKIERCSKIEHNIRTRHSSICSSAAQALHGHEIRHECAVTDVSALLRADICSAMHS